MTTATTIAVIGTGLIGPRHAKSIIACNNAELLCIVDPAFRADGVAKSFGVLRWGSIKEMLQGGHRPDAAIVCTPNGLHVSVALELLKAGIHVLVEKPISTTIQDGTALVRAARASGKQLLVGHHRRFNPYVTTTKQALLDGVIGQPIAVSGIWACYKPAPYFEPPTQWRATATDGGVVLINLIHEIDILRYLLGPIVKVHAEQTTSQRGHEAEEGAAVLLRFSSGVVGTFLISDATPSAYSFEQGTGENPTIPRSGKDFYRIFGTEGTLSVGDMRLSRHASGQQKSWTNDLQETTRVPGNETPFDKQIEHLVHVVRGAEFPRCSGEDGLAALVVCDAIKQGMKSGTAVDIMQSKL